LNLNSEKEENDLIFYYSLLPNAEIDMSKKEPKALSKLDINKIKEKLEFPNISSANTIKTQVDFGMKLDLMFSKEPRSYHISVLEGKLSKHFLAQVEQNLAVLEDNKYKAIGDFIQSGVVIQN
jgi:hypothetical protein